MVTETYLGRVCAKHPQYHGLRRKQNRECMACHREQSRQRKRTTRYREYNKQYLRRHMSGINVQNKVRIGYICELLVAADLNARCGRAYPNPEPQTKDDVYAKSPTIGWFTCQVKKTQVNRSSGQIYDPRNRRREKGKITSDVVAAVDLEARRVQYYQNGSRFPKELPLTPVDLVGIINTFEAEK